MGIHVTRRLAELGEGVILAPERFDPRRQSLPASPRRLADYAEVCTENVSAQSLDPGAAVLILDTTHAYDGFVIFRHEPVAARELGSAKRRLQPGDVIISRLRPYLRQVAYVDPQLFALAPGGNQVAASTEFFVVRGRDGFDPACLVPFLLSAQVQAALAAGQEGGHHPRFARELLLSLSVPDCVLRSPYETASQMRALAAGLRCSLQGCRSLVQGVDAAIRGAA